MQHSCFPDLGKEKLCSILVFGNACFNIIVRINHDNVASRGAVGRTHTIVRFQTRSRRKRGTSNGEFRGLDILVGWISTRRFCVVGFICPINIIPFLSLVYISATTPRAATPHLYHTGYHAFTTTAQRSRLCIYHGYHAEGYHAPSLTTGYHACVDYTSRLHPGYNTRAITLHHTRTSGYHTRHSSSYFIVYVSPAIRPPALLTYTTTGAPHATTYSIFPFSPLSTYLGCIAICQRCACLRH